MQLYQTLEDQLRKEPNFVSDDGQLKKWVVLNKSQNNDPELIGLLLDNPELKQTFFTEIKGALVFNQPLFTQFLEQKNYLNDSYTEYKNKIGLSIGNKYIHQRNEVSLVWPFKDCVLEGGQSREEDKREEIFFNEVLAQDEITQLFEPKVLTNGKRYTKDGELPLLRGQSLENFGGFKRGEDGTIKDNLIIKGNNLLALHSLKKEFAGKVKMIYIDPPYNTGNDGFKYNDSFNHSTWLTFMKNRLEVARKMLREDGLIFVHCDNNEQAYLKVLLDEIFHRENFVETISVVNNPRGRDYGGIANMHELIHVYSTNPVSVKMYKVEDKDKKFQFEDNKGGFEIRELRNRNTAFNDKNRPNLCYPFYLDPNSKLDNDFLKISLEPFDGSVEVWPAKSGDVQTVWRWGKSKSKENLNINIAGKKMMESGRYMIVEKYRETKRLARSVWWDKDVNSEKGTIHLKELFKDKVFNFPKPETLLSRVIEISTLPEDIVLDYHLGSGTTAAVAHKMGRQYIGIEQMDYIETVAVERLKKVIEGEQGGISKAVKWEGGGDFVYLELKKYNQEFIDRIESGKDTVELLGIWEDMKKRSFINYNVDIQKQDQYIEEFKALALEEQKRHLVEILDKNQLYVNLSSLEDKDFGCSKEEKKLTRDFYGLNN